MCVYRVAIIIVYVLFVAFKNKALTNIDSVFSRPVFFVAGRSISWHRLLLRSVHGSFFMGSG